MPPGFYPRPPVPLNCVCLICGTPFHTKPSRILVGKGRYCSRACTITGLGTGPGSRPWAKGGGPQPIGLLTRLWMKVRCDLATGCWVWTGAVRMGYGVIGLDGFKHRIDVHRLSWEMHVGPIPAGLWVLHKCDAKYPAGDTSYRRCLRPNHLFLGTPRENTHDMMAKGRAKWQRGH